MSVDYFEWCSDRERDVESALLLMAHALGRQMELLGHWDLLLEMDAEYGEARVMCENCYCDARVVVGHPMMGRAIKERCCWVSQ